MDVIKFGDEQMRAKFLETYEVLRICSWCAIHETKTTPISSGTMCDTHKGKSTAIGMLGVRPRQASGEKKPQWSRCVDPSHQNYVHVHRQYLSCDFGQELPPARGGCNHTCVRYHNPAEAALHYLKDPSKKVVFGPSGPGVPKIFEGAFRPPRPPPTFPLPGPCISGDPP